MWCWMELHSKDACPTRQRPVGATLNGGVSCAPKGTRPKNQTPISNGNGASGSSAGSSSDSGKGSGSGKSSGAGDSGMISVPNDSTHGLTWLFSIGSSSKDNESSP